MMTPVAASATAMMLLNVSRAVRRWSTPRSELPNSAQTPMQGRLMRIRSGTRNAQAARMLAPSGTNSAIDDSDITHDFGLRN